MKRLLTIAFALAAFSALPLAAASVEGVLVDNMCMTKVAEKGYDAAKMHEKSCALMDSCKESGFAIIKKDGAVVKLDKAGNALAIKALGTTSKDKDIVVKADGDLKGDTLAAKSVSIL